jgi:hypothetical protein
MPDKRPDYSLNTVTSQRGAQKPELMVVRFFQIKEAEYMRPPLAEQLLEPDGSVAPSHLSRGVGVAVTSACTCNSVCTCVPVSTCTCNTVCTCNVVSTSHGVGSSGGGCYGGGGGFGGYFSPCF